VLVETKRHGTRQACSQSVAPPANIPNVPLAPPRAPSCWRLHADAVQAPWDGGEPDFLEALESSSRHSRARRPSSVTPEKLVRGHFLNMLGGLGAEFPGNHLQIFGIVKVNMEGMVPEAQDFCR